jgi:hypothetical protein
MAFTFGVPSSTVGIDLTHEQDDMSHGTDRRRLRVRVEGHGKPLGSPRYDRPASGESSVCAPKGTS